MIDLGHNSLKMVSYEVQYDGSYRAYNQVSEITRIGEGLSKNGLLDQQRMEDTLRELEVFSEINRMEKVHNVLAVATSAVREASNRDEFLRKAKSRAGVDFRVLTQEEEALFSFVGGARDAQFRDLLFFDLGGGSLEMVHSNGSSINKVLSLPIGALKMADRYKVKGKETSPKEYQKMVEKISTLIPDRKNLGLSKNTILIGVGGTLRALARFDQWNRNYPIYKMHNYVMARKSLNDIHKMLLDTKLERIAKINAFGKGRSQSVTAGSLIIGTLMDKLGFETVTLSSHGLRDGILTEYLRAPGTITSGSYSVEEAERALKIFDESKHAKKAVFSLEDSSLVSPWEKGILNEAIGNHLDLYLSTRPELLFYSILSQDSTLSHTEQIVEAISMVRAKAPRMSRWFQERYSMLVGQVDRKSINKMSHMIQLAEILYISGSRARFERTGDSVKIFVKASAKKTFPELLFRRITKDLSDASGVKLEAQFS